jgi:polysaccharide biosynthesis/export protein
MITANIRRVAMSTISSVVLCVFFATGTLAQRRIDSTTPQPPGQVSQQFDPTMQRAYGGYIIGIGDIVNIRIAEEDDVSGRYQVTDSGDVQIPLLSKPVHAAGLTTFDFSKHLSEELKKQQILKEPYVTVFIERGMTQNVSIVGPVARPGIYPIEKPTRVMDVVSMSGGLLPTAGQTITITHAQAEQTGGAKSPSGPNSPVDHNENESVQTLDVVALMSGNPKDNVLVKPGDQITVAPASVVYVVGAVNRPGAFAIQDPNNGMTVLRAIAMVEGTMSTASLGKTIIVRKSASESAREEIPLDLNKIMKGKSKDPALMANDILFVPQSGFKQGIRKAGDVATRAAEQVAGYAVLR